MNHLSAPGDQPVTAPEGARPLRVLLLSQMVVYPADAGPKVKTLQVLRRLAARRHRRRNRDRHLQRRLSRGLGSDEGFLDAGRATQLLAR